MADAVGTYSFLSLVKSEKFPAGLSLYAEGETSINKNKQIYFLFFHYFPLLIIYIISKRNAPEPNQSSHRGDKRGAVEGSYFLLLLGLAKDLTQRKPM